MVVLSPNEISSRHWVLNNLSKTRTWLYPKSLALKNHQRGISYFFQDKYADAEFVYIGDNLRKDFITPNKLGWKTICLLDDGRNIHRQDSSCPEEYLPNVKIHTLKELLSL